MDWYSICQLAFSLLAASGLLISGLGLAAAGFQVSLSTVSQGPTVLTYLLMAAGLGFSGLLLLPSAVFAFLRLIDRSPVGWWNRWVGFSPLWLVLAFPPVLAAGYWISSRPEAAWVLLPPIHILAVGIPVAWLLSVTTRKLPLGSPQRAWGVFGSGLALGPFLIMILESMALLGMVIGIIVLLLNQPGMFDKLRNLRSNLMQSSESPEQMFELITPYLANPLVVLAAFLFGTVLVPLIEETLKPIGVWLLMGRKLRPAAGFAAGALSGAGYALFENLALTSSGEQWAYVVSARIGTAVIHILTASLMGWALAVACQKRAYVQFAVVYALAVTIHGLWNGLSIISLLTSLSGMPGLAFIPPFILEIGRIAPIGLGILMVGGFIVLLLSNQAMRRTLAK